MALDYELEVYDRAGKDYDLRKLPMLPFILREIHNNETTFFNIPGFYSRWFSISETCCDIQSKIKTHIKEKGGRGNE